MMKFYWEIQLNFFFRSTEINFNRLKENAALDICYDTDNKVYDVVIARLTFPVTKIFHCMILVFNALHPPIIIVSMYFFKLKFNQNIFLVYFGPLWSSFQNKGFTLHQNVIPGQARSKCPCPDVHETKTVCKNLECWVPN